jgi:hypothetical protein
MKLPVSRVMRYSTTARNRIQQMGKIRESYGNPRRTSCRDRARITGVARASQRHNASPETPIYYADFTVSLEVSGIERDDVLNAMQPHRGYQPRIMRLLA